jgi:hypothetical protein
MSSYEGCTNPGRVREEDQLGKVRLVLIAIGNKGIISTAIIFSQGLPRYTFTWRV